MKNLLVAVMLLSGCGYESVGNEAMGQVKKVVRNTPLICPDYTAVDISLGVMRNGVGSMSTEDVWYYVDDASLIKTLQTGVESGALVKISYDVNRWRWCVPEHFIKAVSVVSEGK